MTGNIKTLTVVQLAQWLDGGPEIVLVDVREDEEVSVCRIGSNTQIPLSQIGQRMSELPQDKPLVLYCHHGRRSERAVQYLQQQGFEQVYNLEGGIDAWAVQIDPSMARY